VGGSAVSEHVEHLARQGISVPEAEPDVDLPDLAAHVWEWFCELQLGRPAGMSGVEPIAWEAIDAWARCTDRDPEPWEVTAIKQMDATWIRVQMEQRKNG